MGRDRLIAIVTLTVVTMLCAGCGHEVAGAGQHAGALSATPRTITWKAPTPKATVRRATATTAHATATPSASSSAPESFAGAVGPLVNSDDDHVAVAVADLTTGQTDAYDGNQDSFVTASIAKADILSTLLYQTQDRGGLTGDEQKLATTMIENSNNDAATDLYYDAGGASGIEAANRVFGLSETTVGTGGYWGVTTTTVDDQIRLLRQIFTTQSVLSATSRDYIQGLMENVESDQQWGVPVAADPGTIFANKNGWLNNPVLWEINSIGEVTHDGQLMLIAVLSSDNDDESDGIDLIQDVVTKAAGAIATQR